MKFALLLALVLMLLPVAAKPATYEVVTHNDIVFAEHDGVKLFADLYSPKDLDAAPVLVGVHGGGWQIGSRNSTRTGGRIWRRTATPSFRSNTG